MNSQLIRTLSRMTNETALIEPGCQAPIIAAIEHISHQAAEPERLKEIKKIFDPQIEMRGSVAVIPIKGTLAQDVSLYERIIGFEDTRPVGDLLQRASTDSQVRSIMLDIDSPGGFVTGVPELGQQVRQAARRKPVMAFTDGMMASAAYWLGSQAQQVIASPSSRVGSIGAFVAVMDVSRLIESMGVSVELFKNREGTFKAAGMVGTSLSDEQRDEIQSGVQRVFDQFRNSVVSMRSNIPDDAMRGQVFDGQQARDNNLVDAVGTRSFAISRLQ